MKSETCGFQERKHIDVHVQKEPLLNDTYIAKRHTFYGNFLKRFSGCLWETSMGSTL